MPDTDRTPHAGGQALPQVWRVPTWQAAALVLLATLLAAFDIYGHPSVIAKLAAGFVALAALVAATCALRYALVADADGIWIRRLFRTVLVEWRDVARVALTTARRGGMTVRVTRTDGSYADVPPSLVLPTLPTTIPKARSIVNTTALRLNALAAAQKH